MRVISGIAKGRRLKSPKLKPKGIRPALDQVKESVFNILFDVRGLVVLDLFAGTGAMGIEALSRGAKEAVFTDCSKEATKLIGENLKLCRLEKQAHVLRQTAKEAMEDLQGEGRLFDLIFVDPPYESHYVEKTLLQLSQSSLLHEESVIVVEHHPKEPIPPIDRLVLTDQRKYGQTLISFLKAGNQSEESRDEKSNLRGKF